MEFKDLQKLVYKEYKKNGFEEFFNKNGICGDLAEIGLFVTEIGEALQFCRDNDIPDLSIELVDIIVRVFNFCNRKNINLEPIILMKNEINKTRGKYHGKKFI